MWRDEEEAYETINKILWLYEFTTTGIKSCTNFSTGLVRWVLDSHRDRFEECQRYTIRCMDRNRSH